jgi:hypothetical protein
MKTDEGIITIVIKKHFYASNRLEAIIHELKEHRIDISEESILKRIKEL